ncbi:MAG: ATP-binding protein [Deltaproteobacteria bacterium]|nr:ATP-binding protein [Deltaproteobacteria bacterium]
MRVVFASGKGGTGKTLLSTSLALHMSRAGSRVTYADADVEEPNGHVFLRPTNVVKSLVTVPLPVMVMPTCSGCGLCQEFCEFNAVISLKDRAVVFPELCHGCGGCLLVCPEYVLGERGRDVGVMTRGRSGDMDFRMATLHVGEARSAPLIEALTSSLPADGVVIVDAPPGTSCSTMAAVRGADLVVLATEPTPFGIHDLKLAVGMTRALNVPSVVVVNRADLGSPHVLDLLEKEGLEVLASIPHERAIAEAYAHGEMALDVSPSLRRAIESLERRILQ